MKILRDLLTLSGLGCLAAAAWLCPPLGLLYSGGGLIVAAVALQRYETLKKDGKQS